MVQKKQKNDGKNFEQQCKLFFLRAFEHLGLSVLKNRLQFSGTQDGFDIQFMISDGRLVRNMYIECKDYKTDIAFGNIYSKLHDLESSYTLHSENDIAIFISPRSNFGNNRNPEKAETVFNRDKYPFKVCIFEKDHGVHNFFAIEQDIYEAIYKKPLTFKVNKEIELERFKSLLFHKIDQTPLHVDESRKSRFITHLKREEFYIKRGVTLIDNPETDDRQLFNIVNKEVAEFGLMDALNHCLTDAVCPGLVLLGNPGMGKSIELQELTMTFWKNREEHGWIPFYRQINSFGKEDTLEDQLPSDWRKIPQLLIILDGLDEVSFGQEFRTKVEKFIQNYEERNAIKFVISCRTNIYESAIKDITNFDCCTLNSLSFSSATAYLGQKYQMPTGFEYYKELNRTQKEFFENPYYLNLLGDYHKQHKALPNNVGDLMERYVDKRLNDDTNVRGKSQSYDSAEVLIACKKVALTMEAMQTRRITGEHLTMLLGEQKGAFASSCFVRKILNEDKWEFEHRNLQEFLVAKTMGNFSSEKIIDFIALKADYPKTHPSWLNSISYLLNILEVTSDKLKYLIDWLRANDPTVLFKADRTRISDAIRTDVFQSRFNNLCKEQTLWVRKYDQDTIEMIRFGDSSNNRDFLFQELQDKSNHRRTRISAMDLLSEMDISLVEAKFKKLLLTLLKAPLDEVDIGFKADILHTVQNARYHRTDGYLTKLVKAVGYIDHPRIASVLLLQIGETNADTYSDYIKSIAEVIVENKERKYPARENFMTSEKEHLRSALLNFAHSGNQVFALNTFLEHRDVIRLEHNTVMRLITKMVKHYKEDQSLYVLMLSWVKKAIVQRTRFYKFENEIAMFFDDTKTSEQAFKNIHGSGIPMQAKRRFLAHIVSTTTLPYILKDYHDGVIEAKELFYFRNVLNAVNTNLALEFESMVLLETDYRLEEDFIDIEMREKWQKYHKTKDQLSFNLLHDRKKLHQLAKEYFAFIGKAEIDWDDMMDNKETFWQNLDLQNRYLSSFIELVNDVKRRTDENIKIEDVQKYIDDDAYILYKVKGILTGNSKDKISENASQTEWIKKWCHSNIENVDFSKALLEEGSRNYWMCEFIWFFGIRYDIPYEEKTYLDMLWVDYYKEKGGFVGYNYILERVSLEKVQARIVQNMKLGIEHFTIFKNHAVFAIENGLTEVFEIIANYLSDSANERYRRLDLLEKYSKTSGNVKLLRDISEQENPLDLEKSLFWDTMGLLIKLGNHEYPISKILGIMKSTENRIIKLTSIKYLLKAGYPKSLNLFNQWLKEGFKYDRKAHRFFSSVDFTNFYAPDAIEDIVELIELSQLKKIVAEDFFDPVRTAYEVLKSFYQNANSAEFDKLFDCLEACKNRLVKNPEVDMFHIHSIINEAWSAYFKMKSKPMTFKEIAERIEASKYEV